MSEVRCQRSEVSNDRGSAPPPTFHNAGTAGIPISDIWFLSSGSDAAACASLLPRYQRSDIRDQRSEMISALAFSALRQRCRVTELVISEFRYLPSARG